jgi:hypothetical protein
MEKLTEMDLAEIFTTTRQDHPGRRSAGVRSAKKGIRAARQRPPKPPDESLSKWHRRMVAAGLKK